MDITGCFVNFDCSLFQLQDMIGQPKVCDYHMAFISHFYTIHFSKYVIIYEMSKIFTPGRFQTHFYLSIFQIHGGPGLDPVSLCWSTYFIQTLHIVIMAKHLWDLSGNYSRVLSMSLHIQEYTSKTYFTNNIAEIYWP